LSIDPFRCPPRYQLAPGASTVDMPDGCRMGAGRRRPSGRGRVTASDPNVGLRVGTKMGGAA